MAAELFSSCEFLQMISLVTFDYTPMTKFFENKNYHDVKKQSYNQLTMY